MPQTEQVLAEIERLERKIVPDEFELFEPMLTPYLVSRICTECTAVEVEAAMRLQCVPVADWPDVVPLARAALIRRLEIERAKKK